ncbi:Erythronate-4-phosphate dehydrogenase family protein [Quillaja saponaria]|uniref:Erythronate-4-phosphate dehydrogenase family protein n=1 Tax=Quillaja saponaria TaxID=32244 RepID=A0AAD7PKF6_QUISA|nr:Erythronate-4-phosphate dehydrogenase family protein [Quillaja saponaria]
MEDSHETHNNGEEVERNLQIIRYSPYKPFHVLSSPWFDLRVFYVRVSDFRVDDSTPEFLTLNHIPLSPDTLLEVNGVRNNIYFEGVSSLLRRDRVDKNSEEATFVSTDNIRLSGSVKFEVYDKEDCLLSGVLEMSKGNGNIGESKNNAKQWSINCESEVTASTGFLKGKQVAGPGLPCPKIEVYIAGCFSGTPIILTKTLQLNFQKKHSRKCTLDAIPEYETIEYQKDVSSKLDFQVAKYRNFKPESEDDYNGMYWNKAGYMNGEDGELSWFNAGVRVGVGIGLGVCLGIGIGVGLLARTYQTTKRNFKRRLI